MHTRYFRYGDFRQNRYSIRFIRWLNGQAVRWSSTTQQVYNALLMGFTSKQIETATPGAPVNTGAPVITGSAVQNNILSTTNGTWTGQNLVFTYQWFATGVAISGATHDTYKTNPTDVGKNITSKVTATNPSGSVLSPASNAIGPIT